ncbi:uncharacterized protein MONOS_13909 [Monocercomonoides exilis]|uniref:uncharacterized protein n=1 Tax=Monocercomonoides exilis TaxID=2049356 RepID=UPI00355A8379|nr:hypothetical protein MONOS_13909 [Monocercomonoides exilis]|eukprot:MONOS_13909.1-p1 / transcript=MONOS_13909.1 / gene=MONOS_13909 / organism=Monocercomonoides_exilis_PA203 / gene_product=unspecified product / transcript_product=unspecified product / location=Mono_scaffold00902:17604-20907(+) / protein_length=1040 / sequence_SO=supercontig / SO=protein_coding / is_pseudo=false
MIKNSIPQVQQVAPIENEEDINLIISKSGVALVEELRSLDRQYKKEEILQRKWAKRQIDIQREIDRRREKREKELQEQQREKEMRAELERKMKEKRLTLKKPKTKPDDFFKSTKRQSNLLANMHKTSKFSPEAILSDIKGHSEKMVMEIEKEKQEAFIKEKRNKIRNNEKKDFKKCVACTEDYMQMSNTRDSPIGSTKRMNPANSETDKGYMSSRTSSHAPEHSESLLKNNESPTCSRAADGLSHLTVSNESDLQENQQSYMPVIVTSPPPLFTPSRFRATIGLAIDESLDDESGWMNEEIGENEGEGEGEGGREEEDSNDLGATVATKASNMSKYNKMEAARLTSKEREQLRRSIDANNHSPSRKFNGKTSTTASYISSFNADSTTRKDQSFGLSANESLPSSHSSSHSSSPSSSPATKASPLSAPQSPLQQNDFLSHLKNFRRLSLGSVQQYDGRRDSDGDTENDATDREANIPLAQTPPLSGFCDAEAKADSDACARNKEDGKSTISLPESTVAFYQSDPLLSPSATPSSLQRCSLSPHHTPSPSEVRQRTSPLSLNKSDASPKGAYITVSSPRSTASPSALSPSRAHHMRRSSNAASYKSSDSRCSSQLSAMLAASPVYAGTTLAAELRMQHNTEVKQQLEEKERNDRENVVGYPDYPLLGNHHEEHHLIMMTHPLYGRPMSKTHRPLYSDYDDYERIQERRKKQAEMKAENEQRLSSTVGAPSYTPDLALRRRSVSATRYSYSFSPSLHTTALDSTASPSSPIPPKKTFPQWNGVVSDQLQSRPDNYISSPELALQPHQNRYRPWYISPDPAKPDFLPTSTHPSEIEEMQPSLLVSHRSVFDFRMAQKYKKQNGSSGNSSSSNSTSGSGEEPHSPRLFASMVSASSTLRSSQLAETSPNRLPTSPSRSVKGGSFHAPAAQERPASPLLLTAGSNLPASLVAGEEKSFFIPQVKRLDHSVNKNGTSTLSPERHVGNEGSFKNDEEVSLQQNENEQNKKEEIDDEDLFNEINLTYEREMKKQQIQNENEEITESCK